MGQQCCGLTPVPHPHQPLKELTTARQQVYKLDDLKLHPKQLTILRLIYNDLKSRIVQKQLNIENFLLFFHKNDFWGQMLFKQFDYGESNLITEEQFVRGIAKIFKANQNQKISLLFKFFSNHSSKFKADNQINQSTLQQKNGVKFDDFLVMLYNYPKEDLKQILNDKDFFQNQLKKSLVSVGQSKRLQSVYNIGMAMSNKRLNQKSATSKNNVYQLDDKSQSDASKQVDYQPSMLGRDIIKNLKKRESQQTTIKVSDGQKTLQIRTTNIHQLVKKFAKGMFKQLGVDYKSGVLNINQFSNWIKHHKILYDNYYNGFHNEIWQLDEVSLKPQYLLVTNQKQSFAKYSIGSLNNPIKVFIVLLHSIIIVCEQQLNDNPFDIICLDGLEVKKIFDKINGYGLQITHRDGIYQVKQLFFKNQNLRQQWAELLKFFKGGSIQTMYTMGKKIGTGKFSIVYQGIEKQTQQKYAIKVIESYKLDIQAKQLIAHQTSIMQIFSHPLLVQYKQNIQTRTHLYIITQLCKGKDLFQFIKDFKYLDQLEASMVTQQIIVGVRYMHSLGIIHRDLKPQNIMVSYDQKTGSIDKIKIIDFGFANYLTSLLELKPEQTLAGTPNYIAPELLLGQPICYKTDNFAIGSILYFMLSGTLPFNDKSLTQIFSKTLDGKYSYSGKRWESISKEAKELIDGFLKVNPNERLSLDDALKHPWFTYVKKMSKIQKKTS